MTDITDQDRRAAHEWAASIDPEEMSCWSDSARAVARVILATVDAPTITLAEALRYRADMLDNGDPDGDTPQALRDLATSAAQMEQDAEDRQEWNRRITEQNATLARERDEARAEVERVRDAVDPKGAGLPPGMTISEAVQTLVDGIPTGERVGLTDAQLKREYDLIEARAEVDHLKRDLAEAYKTRDARDDEVDRLRAEVERLTAENENLRKTDNYREFRDKFLTVQKGVESNAETPDPADVQPGEAWVVNIDGVEIVPGFKASVGWICYRFFGGTTKAIGDERITLVSRLVPAPRVITNPDELDRLGHRTVIRDNAGVMFQSIVHGWYQAGDTSVHRSDDNFVCLPVTVLWEPGE